ncbi:DUF1080 domain-containing protein [Stieleria sp. TO1_6]|uniref:family 16 glycoside hydrolase n=1 Tax=Stieleria tagensis TaxID=2956795 RepID=UPI00209BA8A6|nr:family 16 glycoside hydrolase [Stieleria tagensis]MCO8121496.1 DUF1080 domain-containing protein [Stieleria tagensis]
MNRLPLLILTLVLFESLWSPPITAQDESAEPSAYAFSEESFWTSQDGKPVSTNWEFSDDEVRLVKPRGGHGSLISPPMPADFDLSWQWKIESGTNTGLKYRVRRFGKQILNNTYAGIEYQIIDDKPDSVGKGSTGSVYDLAAPTIDKPLNPAGQWNQSRVVARGKQLAHYLNGTRVSQITTSGPAWDKAIALSKFYGAENFGNYQPGDRLMLTDHGGKAVFRDFQFTALPTDNALDDVQVSTGPYLGNALRNSWADQHSIVIWTRTTRNPEMEVNGKRFVTLSKREADKLAKGDDAKHLLDVQMPEGAVLSEMIGACPGAPGKVRLIYFPKKQRGSAKTTDWITTDAETDYCAQWKLEDLKADQEYSVVVEATAVENDKTTAIVRGAFRTAPEPDQTEDLKFCVTTCHDFIRTDDGMQGHKIYPTMSKMRPDFIVHAGDIEYYDKPDPWAMTVELMRFKWGRIFALPNNREFYKNTTSYFLKDDHDTLKNDCWAGQTYGSVSFAEGVRIFNEEQFPSHSPRYKTVRWGKDLQVWFLEGRDYRSPNNIPDGPDKTILGSEQKAWLFKTLDESTATFKLICCPTPIVGPDRDNKSDNHANDVFVYEGNQIRNKLAEVDGAIVLCGDRHWQYASHDPEIDLWEFGCGPGSEEHELGWKPGDERPMHRFLRVKGGFLSGELKYKGSEKTPGLTIRHHKVTGEEVSKFQFPQTP